MKLITWNVQWCLGANRVLDPARIVAHTKAMADFDVLCLQEVADNFPELGGGPQGDQFRAIADLLPDHDAVEGVALERRDAEGRPKRFGNMVLSRLPIVSVRRHQLPWIAKGTRNMPRGVIEAVVQTSSGPLRVMTTHLEYSHPDLRRGQVEALRGIHADACARAVLPREDGPHTYARTPETISAVLCGDFNMRPPDPMKHRISEAFDDGAPRLLDAWTVAHGDAPHPITACIVDQSYAPPHCCDYVFVSEDIAPRIKSISCDEDTRVSDHQPLLLELA